MSTPLSRFVASIIKEDVSIYALISTPSSWPHATPCFGTWQYLADVSDLFRFQKWSKKTKTAYYETRPAACAATCTGRGPCRATTTGPDEPWRDGTGPQDPSPCYEGGSGARHHWGWYRWWALRAEFKQVEYLVGGFADIDIHFIVRRSMIGDCHWQVFLREEREA